MMNQTVIPILRIFDVSKAKEFYCGFLGWKIDWSHTFGDNFPIYMQISNEDAILHLTEHFGDACPGSTIRIRVRNIDDMASKLRGKNYKHSKPSAEAMPWQAKEMWMT